MASFIRSVYVTLMKLSLVSQRVAVDDFVGHFPTAVLMEPSSVSSEGALIDDVLEAVLIMLRVDFHSRCLVMYGDWHHLQVEAFLLLSAFVVTFPRRARSFPQRTTFSR